MAKKSAEEREFRARIDANGEWKAAYGGRVGRDRRGRARPPRPVQGEPLSAAARLECCRTRRDAGPLHRGKGEAGCRAARRVPRLAAGGARAAAVLAGAGLPGARGSAAGRRAAGVAGGAGTVGSVQPGGAEGPHTRRGGEGGDRRHQADRSGGAQGAGRGGPAGLAASTDPLVVLARTADPFARKNQKMLDDQVDGRRDGSGRENRPGAVRRLRPFRLSRRDVHAAAVVRAGQGLPDERHHRAAENDDVRLVRAVERLRQQATLRAAAPLRRAARRRSICRRR